jgi:ABC-type glycerol-3-phosphate transport system substrate-binding protein
VSPPRPHRGCVPRRRSRVRRAGSTRRTLFQNGGVANPPKTLTDLLQTAQKINNPPNVYGYTIIGKGDDPALRQFSDLL